VSSNVAGWKPPKPPNETWNGKNIELNGGCSVDSKWIDLGWDCFSAIARDMSWPCIGYFMMYTN
jgi:hypothetical protein